MWDLFPPIPRFSRAFFMKRCETCEALSMPLEMTSSFSRLSQLTWHYTYWFACVGTSLNLHSVKDAFMNQQRLTQAWRVVWDEEAFNTVELMCYWQWSKTHNIYHLILERHLTKFSNLSNLYNDTFSLFPSKLWTFVIFIAGQEFMKGFKRLLCSTLLFIFQANNLYNALSISVLRDYSRNVYVLKIIKRQKSERAFHLRTDLASGDFLFWCSAWRGFHFPLSTDCFSWGNAIENGCMCLLQDVTVALWTTSLL